MGRLKTNQQRQLKKLNKHSLVGGNKMNQSIAPGILPGVKPEDLKSVGCKDCGIVRFIPVCDIKLASQFQTSIGQPMIVNFQGGFACSKCGKVNHFDRTPDGEVPEDEKKEDEAKEPSRIIH